MSQYVFKQLAVATLFAGALAAPAIAHADSTCTSLIASKVAQLAANPNDDLAYTATITNGTGQAVDYVTGTIGAGPSGSLVTVEGDALLQFSFLWNATHSQNFDEAQAVASTIQISSLGIVTLDDVTDGTTLVNAANMTCSGGLMTKVVTSFGLSSVVTVVFGGLEAIPPP